MRFHFRFVVNAPLEAVRDFHRRAASMGAITPPPVIVQRHRGPELLGEGDTMEFTLWLGPLPLRWRARIEEVSPTGFVDRMERGPFRSWVHRHTFAAVDDARTEVIDTLAVELSDAPGRRLLGRGMTLSLPLLFAYRAWKTRRILERRGPATERASV